MKIISGLTGWRVNRLLLLLLPLNPNEHAYRIRNFARDSSARKSRPCERDKVGGLLLYYNRNKQDTIQSPRLNFGHSYKKKKKKKKKNRHSKPRLQLPNKREYGTPELTVGSGEMRMFSTAGLVSFSVYLSVYVAWELLVNWSPTNHYPVLELFVSFDSCRFL